MQPQFNLFALLGRRVRERAVFDRKARELTFNVFTIQTHKVEQFINDFYKSKC